MKHILTKAKLYSELLWVKAKLEAHELSNEVKQRVDYLIHEVQHADFEGNDVVSTKDKEMWVHELKDIKKKIVNGSADVHKKMEIMIERLRRMLDPQEEKSQYHSV